MVHIQTLKIDVFRTTPLKIPQMTETETTQTVGIDNTQIINHEIFQTINQTIITITIVHVKLPRTETLNIQIDNEIILSHYIGIIHEIKKITTKL